MGAKVNHNRLATVLFGKTRRAVLALLYGHPEESFYQREIVRRTGVGMGAAQRELRQLSGAGIIKRTTRGNLVYYQADSGCPVFQELRGLVVKTVGLTDVLRHSLKPLETRIRVAFVHGSLVHGTEEAGSDVDILVVGNVTFAEVSSALSKAQETLSREVNPSVYPVKEFQTRLTAGHHFLKSVIAQEKIFLVGDANVIKRLVAQRLAAGT